MADVKYIKKLYEGCTIAIDNMKGESSYNGKVGEVTFVDGIGQLHGTWGGCAVIPGEDAFHVVRRNEKV